MNEIPASIFLDVFGELCTSDDMHGRAIVSTASEDYSLGMRDLTRTLYTLTVTVDEFPRAVEKSLFTVCGRTYKAVRPPVVKQDALVFVCVIA